MIAVRTEDAEADFAKEIKAIVHSDEFRKVIEDENKQYIAFARPEEYNN